jgi:putative sporulation protein YtxC
MAMQTYHVLLETDNPTYCGAFRSIVDLMMDRVNTDPVRITYQEEGRGSYTLFRFQSWCADEYTLDTLETARAFVSLVVTEWIFQVKEPEVIEEIAADLMLIEDAEEEWLDILPYVRSACQEPSLEQDALFHASPRKSRVYRHVFDYLEEERHLNVLGFVRFRLQDHWGDLFELVEAGFDDYLEDKQYQEFVELLRYFISVQETKHDLIHVVPDLDKQFHLYDGRGERIRLDHLDAVLNMGEQKCREEDYLVSALVTLAPRQIVFHRAEDRQALAQTIANIFDNRLLACTSCPYCLAGRRALDANKPTQL